MSLIRHISSTLCDYLDIILDNFVLSICSSMIFIRNFSESYLLLIFSKCFNFKIILIVLYKLKHFISVLLNMHCLFNAAKLEKAAWYR